MAASPRPGRAPRSRRGVALLAGATLLIGVAEVRTRAPGVPPAPWPVAAAAVVLLAASLAVPLLVAVVATWRWPVVGRHWARRLRTHLALGACAAGAAAALEGTAHVVLPRSAAALTSELFVAGLLWYVLSAAAAHALLLAGRAQRAHAVRLRIVRASEQAGREQAAAQFRAAKTELHPALITHALATAQGLVSHDPAAAERMIVELGLLMREAVAGAAADVVTLGEEVAAARDRSRDEDDESERLPVPPGGAVRFAVDDEVRDVLVPHLVVPVLLACAGEAGWADGGVVVRARRVTLAGEPRLELVVRAAHATPRRVPGARPLNVQAPDTRVPAAPRVAGPHAVAALRRLLHHVYGDVHGDGDARWQFSTGMTADGTPCVSLRMPVMTDDQWVTPARRADPGERAFEDWVVSATHDDVRARRGGGDALIVAGLGALLAVNRWWDAATSHRANWTAGAVLFPAGAAGLALALVGAVAVGAARRWPVAAGDPPGRGLRRHVAVGLGVAVLAAGLRAVSQDRAHAAGLTAAASFTAGEVVSRIGGLFVLYTVFVMVARLTLFSWEHRRTAQIAARAHAAYRSRAAGRRRSELRALKAELNPHFVGNALHTAATLVRSAPEAAGQLLAALGTLAGQAGAQVDVQEVSLVDELAALDPFFALERARLGTAGGQLTVTRDIAPEAAEAAVPHLVLQPLVENAVRHGLAPRGGQGRLTIRARRAGETLELAVVDDGIGARAAPDGAAGGAIGIAVAGAARGPAGGTPGVVRPGTGGLGSGAGLRGVRQRLALLYGVGATCVLEPNPDGGTIVRLTLPFRRITPLGPAGPLLVAAGG